MGFYSACLGGFKLGPAGLRERNGGFKLCSSLARLEFSQAVETLRGVQNKSVLSVTWDGRVKGQEQSSLDVQSVMVGAS